MPGVVDPNHARVRHASHDAIARLAGALERVVAAHHALDRHRQAREIGVGESRNAPHPRPEVPKDQEKCIDQWLRKSGLPPGDELEGLQQTPPAKQAQHADLQEQHVVLPTDPGGSDQREGGHAMGATHCEVEAEPAAERDADDARCLETETGPDLVKPLGVSRRGERGS